MDKLTTLKQNAAALDQQAMAYISAGRLLEAYGRTMFEALDYASKLEAQLKSSQPAFDPSVQGRVAPTV